MQNKDGIEILIEKIPKRGMSRKCQEFLPYVLKQYFTGKPLEQAREELGKGHKGFANKIYYLLEQIKIKGSKKIAGSVMKHPKDIEEGPVFADSMIRHCLRESLEKKLIKSFSSIGINKGFIERRYKDEKGTNEDYKLLQSLSRNPNFYVFVMEEILNRNN